MMNASLQAARQMMIIRDELSSSERVGTDSDSSGKQRITEGSSRSWQMLKRHKRPLGFAQVTPTNEWNSNFLVTRA